MILTGENILLVSSVLIFLSVVAGKTGYRLGMPALLLFLGIGMLFGQDGVGIQFNNPSLMQFIGIMALSVILFSGGMDTKYVEIRPVMWEGIALATLGVVGTALLTGLFIYWASGMIHATRPLTMLESMLMASVMASTDSASVFSILRSRKMRLKQNLRPLLELESGSNDPMAYMLTVLFIGAIQQGGEVAFGPLILKMFIQIAVGLGLGYLIGRLAVRIINRINVQNVGLYSILLLSFVFFTYSFTDLLHGNGYLAVYIAGLVVGNHKIVHKSSISSFFDSFTWLWQIVMFLALGLLVNPRDLLPIAGFALAVCAFMILAGRPASVFVSLAPFRRLTAKARLYVSWVGLRGAVPIIFATYPLIAGIENSHLIFNVVFFITILSLLLQGTTVSWVARLLGLSSPEPEENVFGVELPDEIKSAMSEVEVTESVIASGNRLMDLPLPDNTLVVMVKRDDKFFIPKGKTRLHVGDRILVMSDCDQSLRETLDALGVENYTIRKN